MGVRRAMEMVLAEANNGEGPLFTFGPLIHNKQVLELLESKGVKAVEDLNSLKAGRIVIRAHGIPPQKRGELEKTGLKILDATCPRVTRVQKIIRSYTRKGCSAIIVGDKDHAEVIGLMGHSETPAYLIQSVKDVSSLPDLEPLFVVAQTTQNEQNYREVVNALKGRFPRILIFDTICGATRQRQEEVRAFSGQVDAVVVVGGYHSGNTQRLAQVSKETGIPTFHVETEKELDKKDLAGMEIIGVTAGASTPNWIIKNVVRKIERIRGRRETSFTRLVKRAIKFFVLSNLIVASSAFSFTYAVSILSKNITGVAFPTLAFLYIYAMHTINRYLDKGASAYSDPERASFLKRHWRMLNLTALCAIAAALAISCSISLITFFALSALSLLGIIYSVPLVPASMRHRWPYSRIKDIPGSRSLSEALAWMTVIIFLPMLGEHQIAWPAEIISAVVVFLMAYTRSALFDIFQAQGDLIVGTETLPITIGERKALALLKIILMTTGGILIVSPLLGLTSIFSYLILLPVLTLSLCLHAYEKRWLYPGIPFEALVESNFFLAGLLAVVWQCL